MPKNKRKDDESVPAAKPPKRARTAYLVFCDRYRPQIMKAVHPEPNAKFTREEMQAVTTKLASMWKAVSPSELAECKAEAETLKHEYEAAKAALPPGTLKRTKNKKKNAQILVAGSGEKPKRARTAYLIFCDRFRPQIMKEERSDPTSKFTREQMQRVTTRLATMWRQAQPMLLAQCRRDAELYKKEYMRKKAAYVPPVYATASKGKKVKKAKGGKESDKPKRPRTAYLLFAEDCRAKLKKTNPTLNFTDMSRLVSKEWKNLSDAKKNQYQRVAEKEQEKHRVAKASWEAKQNLGVSLELGSEVVVA